MPIGSYIKTGTAFTPEALSAMGEALEGATVALKIDDEMRREAVGQFIIQLAQWDGSLDAAALRDRTVAALGGLTPAYPILEDGDSGGRAAAGRVSGHARHPE
jgi:hypothetical protein